MYQLLLLFVLNVHAVYIYDMKNLQNNNAIRELNMTTHEVNCLYWCCLTQQNKPIQQVLCSNKNPTKLEKCVGELCGFDYETNKAIEALNILNLQICLGNVLDGVSWKPKLMIELANEFRKE